MEIRAVPSQEMYVVLFSDATPAEMDRARRILDAAVLAIQDRAPQLFTGVSAPKNTNPSDINNYRSESE